jgi:hypothetical protein
MGMDSWVEFWAVFNVKKGILFGDGDVWSFWYW